MVRAAKLSEYMAEMRSQVCDHCISRLPGAPPCKEHGVNCGIEQHLEQVINICRKVDSPLIDPYLDKLRDEVCADCAYRDEGICPCPLSYLLPRAVCAVETVEARRRILADRNGQS